MLLETKELREAFHKMLKERDAEIATLTARAEKAEAACAEMRQVIERSSPNQDERLHIFDDMWWIEHSHHALSTDCGQGWLSPEKVKARSDALDEFLSAHTATGGRACQCRTCERARAALKP